MVARQLTLERERAGALLEEFAGLLEREAGTLPKMREIRQSVAAARKEVTRSSPRWDKVNKALAKNRCWRCRRAGAR